MTEPSCIFYPGERRVLVLRKALIDALAAAPHPQVAAGILSQFIHWTDYKMGNLPQARHHNRAAVNENMEPAQDEELWIYKTVEELQTELLGLAGETRIIESLKWLVDAGFLERRTNPRYRWDKTFQYRLNIEFTQARIEHRKTTESIPQDDGLKAVNPGSQDRENKTAIPEETPKETGQEGISEMASPRQGMPRALQFAKVAQSNGSSVRGRETSGKTPITDLPDVHPARLLAKLVIDITGNASGCTTLSEASRSRLETPLKTLDGKLLPSVMELAATYPAEFKAFVEENIRACLGFDGVPKTLNKAIEFTVSRTRPRRIEVDFEERGVLLVEAQQTQETTGFDTRDLKGDSDGDFWKKFVR